MPKRLFAAMVVTLVIVGLGAVGCGDDSGAGGGDLSCTKATECPAVDCSGIPTSVCFNKKCDTDPATACVPAS